MSTASDSVDSPKLVLTEETNSPPSDDQSDWRVKACELLETHIKVLKQSNVELAMKSAAMSCCLMELLGDLSVLSKNASESEDENWLVKQLGHVMQSQSVNVSELFSESCPPVTPSTDQSIISDSGTPVELSTGPSAKRAKPEVVRQHKRRKTHHEPKVDTTLRRELSCAFDESEDDEAESEEVPNEELMLDAAVVRAAFRLFAKHIGPSLKREYRTEYGCPPTQSWLANQLLARWDNLSPYERRTYHKRVLSTSSASLSLA